ncbi:MULTISPECIES: hypothetical protein [Acinetobacter]|uniref:hypothetical protein n=1 Tax=Acinetobacter TaxID=469 RepID=UPI00141A9473|nr:MULTISPECIES: hypothetical protein [Acinetobacter]MCS4297064.1 ElaB/YqjD/DUF883 family membrane-anchored ribosome-binding protein [Acinetobacter guillouiae]MCW2251186.1 ElaB/YqjD/DUF883 family membrane-anchored ribosome-binding protein [Acinetobacter sp. BIGb0204]NII36716.1 ElaB/YqjD/DUF883 family membrane-anchored ribosome-binding protein [Acinetobacter sp. BIGb0196]
MNKKTISRFKAILTRCIIGITAVLVVPYATQTMAATSYATQASPAQLSKLAYNMNANMAQRNLNTSEKNLYQQLYNIANNQTSLFDPSITTTIQQYESIRSKIRQQFSTVRQLAINTYGNQSQQKILLATNAFILMYYDALSRNNPKFFWPNLGIFVANDVRSTYALTFSLSNALDPLNVTNGQNIIIAGMNVPTLQATIAQANNELINGQANVMADIGGLSIMHQHYDALVLAQQLTSYGPTLTQAFQLQKIADEEALRSGIYSSKFKKLATDAAISFGIHEQEKILQPMWDKPIMRDFAKINNFMLSLSLENLGLRGDIFVGINKFKLIFTPYLIIRAPFTATNLANVQHRIAIARNGFNVLNEWKQNIFFAPWIPIYQSHIGKGNGLYQPVGAR